MQQKFYQRNKHLGSFLVIYSKQLLKSKIGDSDNWTKKTRKLITMYKMRQRDDIDSLCVFMKKGGSSLPSIENCVDATIQGADDFRKKRHCSS